MKPFRRIALISRSEIPGKEETLKKIVEIVEKAGGEIHIDPVHCDVPALAKCKRFKELRGFDLIIILGGDGTTLRTVQELKDFSIPLFTVNRGTVGFLAAADTEELESILPSVLRGEGIVEEREMLLCRIQRKGKELLRNLALNEVVVSQGAIARLIFLKTTVNGEPLTTFRADGLIIATPTGSTAYSLSAGGPIVHPAVQAIILTPINPHAFNQKPLEIPSTEEIAIEIPARESRYEDCEVSLTLDGQTHHALEPGDQVIVTRHSERVRFLRQSRDTFYEALRGKLGWGE